MKKRNKKIENEFLLSRFNKKAIAVETLVWWIIGIAVLAIMIVLAVVLKDKLWEIGGYLKDVFRGRG